MPIHGDEMAAMPVYGDRAALFANAEIVGDVVDYGRLNRGTLKEP